MPRAVFPEKVSPQQKKSEPRVSPRTMYRPGEQLRSMPEVGIAETLAQVTVKPLFKLPTPPTPSQTISKIVSPKESETVHPFAGFAGMIAPAEATAYSAGRLVGLTTPRPPPTLISLTPGEAMKYGPEYAAGTVAGDIMLSIGMGKATEKIWEALPSSVTKPVSKVAEKLSKPFRPITQPIAERLEKAALWPHERIAPGIVDIPEFSKPLPMELAYQEMAWELAESPKTSAILVTKYSGDVTEKWAMEHWIAGAGKLATYAFKEVTISEGLHKDVSGIDLDTGKGLVQVKPGTGKYNEILRYTRMSVYPGAEGTIIQPEQWKTLFMRTSAITVPETLTPTTRLPYIPEVATFTMKGFAQAFGIGITIPGKILPQLIPKPPIEKEKEKPSILPDTKSLPHVFPGIEEELIPKSVQKLPAIPKVAPKTEQLQKVASVEPMLQLQIPYKLGKPNVPFKLPTYRRTRVRSMRGFYGWIRLEVPVKGLNLRSLEKLMLGSRSSRSRRRRRK